MSSSNNHLKELADNPAVVVVAYTCALLPWAILYALDSISDRWKTIAHTRRTGIIHIVLSLPPLAYMVFYIHLQRISADYKEMSAGIYAVLFSLFHMMRTAWGLFQLEVFKRWNVRALTCLTGLGYTPRNLKPQSPSIFRKIIFILKNLLAKKPFVNVDDRDSGTFNLDLSEISFDQTVEQVMLVNNSLIDNEFHDTELPVRIEVKAFRDLASLRSAKSWLPTIACTEPEETVLRWTTTFLSRFGSGWLSEYTSQMPVGDDWESRRASFALRLGRLAVFQTTVGAPGDGDLVSVFFPINLIFADVSHPDFDAKGELSLEKFDKRALPYHFKQEGTSILQLHRFPKTLRDAIGSLSTRAVNELDQTGIRAVEKITSVQVAGFLQLMCEENWGGQTFEKARRLEGVLCLKPEKEFYESVLMGQLGFDSSKNISTLTSIIPLKENVLVFGMDSVQAGIHIDNWLALHVGKILDAVMSRFPGAYSTEGGTGQSVFEMQKQLEYMRLAYEASIGGRDSLGEAQSIQFHGWLMEGVRHSVEKWVRSREDQELSFEWNSRLDSTVYKFTCSKQLSSCLESINEFEKEESTLQSIHVRILWECNYFLSSGLQDALHLDSDILSPSSYIAMIRCLLGFPALRIRTLDDGLSKAGSHSFLIEPVAGPQKLRVVFDCIIASRECSIRLDGETKDYDLFCWQRWKDAFLGRLVAQAEWRSNHNLSKSDWLLYRCPPENIGNDFAKVPCENNGEFFDLVLWRGWPPFHPKICRSHVIEAILNLDLTGDWKKAADCVDKAVGKLFSERTLVADVIYIGSTIESQETEVAQLQRAQTRRNVKGKLLYVRAVEAINANDYKGACQLLQECVQKFRHIVALRKWASLLFAPNALSWAEWSEDILPLCQAIDSWTSEKGNNRDSVRLFRTIDEIVEDARRVCENAENEDQLSIAAYLYLKIHKSEELVPDFIRTSIETFLLKSGTLSKSDKLCFCLGVFCLCVTDRDSKGYMERRGLQYITDVVNTDPNMIVDIGFWLERGKFLKDVPFFRAFSHDPNPLVHVAKDYLTMLFKQYRDLSKRATEVEGDGSTDTPSSLEVAVHNGRVLFKQMGRVTKNIPTAVQIYKLIICQGSEWGFWKAIALNRLGILQECEAEEGGSIERAAKYYKLAISHGNTFDVRAAKNNYGVLLVRHGQGQDSVGEAVQLLEEARGAYKESATNNLAVFYETGQLGTADINKALSYFEKAVLIGHPGAMYNLGVLLKFGNMTQKNEARADSLFAQILERKSELSLMPLLLEQTRRMSSISGEEFPTSKWDLAIEEYHQARVLIKVAHIGKSGKGDDHDYTERSTAEGDAVVDLERLPAG